MASDSPAPIHEDLCSVCNVTGTGECIPEATNHDDLCRRVQDLPLGGQFAAPGASPHATWTGQVVRVRAMHRRLAFISVRRSGCTMPLDEVEFLAATSDDEDDMLRTARYDVCAGDIVRGHGWLENTPSCARFARPKFTLVLRTLSVLSRWRDTNPEEVFQQVHATDTMRVVCASNVAARTLLLPNSTSSIAIDSSSGSMASAASAGAGSTLAVSVPHTSVCSEGGCTAEGGRTDAIRVPCFFHGIPIHNMCKHALQSECRRTHCSYLHTWSHFIEPPGASVTIEQVRRAWQAWRTSNRNLGTLVLSGDAVPVEAKVKHTGRARVFMTWIQAHVPVSLLACGVCDIAGGGGELSWLLSTATPPVTSTIVDPRPPHHSASRLRAAAKAGVTLPLHLQHYFTLEYATSSEHVATCGVLIGLHPDEATEAIVDAALTLSKPFVVVPCCVFSNKFPGRRLASGALVTSYSNFIEYLKEKDARIQVAFLQYIGANTVLYMLPPTE